MYYEYQHRWGYRTFAILLIVLVNSLFSYSICSMQSPELKCVKVIPNGDAIITWTLPPIIDPGFSSYQVYSATSETGPYSLVGSVISSSQTSYTHIGANGDLNTLYYFVESSCGAGGNVSALDTIRQLETPVWNVLTVNDNNQSELHWEPNLFNNEEGVIIYTFNNVSWIPIDTVFGSSINSVTNLSSVPSTVSEEYRLASYDACGNPTTPLSNVFSSIHLTAKADVCSRSALLSWTEYPTSGANEYNYNIYQSSTSAIAGYSLIGTVTAGILNFTATDLALSTTYYYKVEAVNSNGNRAFSNRLTFFSAKPTPPVFFYLRSASVQNNTNIELTAHVDVSGSISEYKVYRSVDTSRSNYTQIGTIPSSATTPIKYVDDNVDVARDSYYYKLVIVDSCGFDGAETRVSLPIVLSVQGSSNTQSNELSWTEYEGFLTGVGSYNIYRGVNGVINPVPIDNLVSTGTGYMSYSDDVSLEVDGTGIFNYYVEAVESGANIFGFTDISISNTGEALQSPIVYIPNSFVPHGKYNPKFTPVSTFVANDYYDFKIYNRIGRVMFSSSTPNEGWDGTFRGNPCWGGVYIYKLEYQSGKGQKGVRTGKLMLMR